MNDDTSSLVSQSFFSDSESVSLSDNDVDYEVNSVESVDLGRNQSNIYDDFNSQL